MPVAIFVLYLISAGGSATGEKPPCNAANAGVWWPPEANRDPKAAMRLARCGELQICSRAFFRFKWQSPTVRFDQLAEDGSVQPPAECALVTPRP